MDIFGLKVGGTINSPLIAPLRPQVPVLEAGKHYLLETVVRTLTLGHLFTQGTSDSNEVWLEVTLRSGDRIIGHSGHQDADGSVDPWSHFINTYMLDRNGQRVDRRNAEDIFTPLYNHQIPPGAADVVHYSFVVPEDVQGTVTVAVTLNYRKFDTTYMRYIRGEEFVRNDLPVTVIASDQVSFAVAPVTSTADQISDIPVWQRWNDYGIGLLRKGERGEMRQAELAFTEVEKLGHADGPLNLARVYLKEGRLDDASQALYRAAVMQPPAYPWSLAWFTGLVNKQNGHLDEAISDFKHIINTDFAEARRREFDFSQDYRVINELAQTLVERSKIERGAANQAARTRILREAQQWFEKTLQLDPENVTAHYNLGLIHSLLGDAVKAAEHRRLHDYYRIDDNARDRAVTVHRSANPAADHAAEAVVIIDLQRDCHCYRGRALVRTVVLLTIRSGRMTAMRFSLASTLATERRRHAALSIVCLLATAGTGCSDNDPSARDSDQSPAPVFEDMAKSSGLVFNHYSGATGKYYMPEIMGAGIALLDYDGDDDLDVFVLQGRQLDPEADGDGMDAALQPGHRLYRNELNPSGKLRFSDVTESAGIGDRGYGMGVAVGDIDNDGDQDLYLTHFGDNALYMNDGSGKFHDATVRSNTEDDRFGSSAAFLDYDADGLLDLFVANYNNFSISNHQACRDFSGHQDYCDPLSYPPAVDRIFRNLGDGRFADATVATGIYEHFGTGLGVISADFNTDGAIDIYVANDNMANIYWINDGHGKFTNEALMSAVAYNADGIAEASMGVVAGDVDSDGDDDLFMTHLTMETNTLYLNDGTGNFRDATDQLNLGASSRPYTGFGTILIDYDNDGDQDLLIANGTVKRQEKGNGDRLAEYGQKNQLYRNDGTGRFEDVSEVAGESFQTSRISRGAAVGDIDNDGDLDAVISNTDGPAELLINRGEPAHHWLSVKLRGVDSNRDGAGARVALLRPNGDRLWRRAHTDGSYLSASDIRVHFGLGTDTQIRGIGVIWPAGGREIWTGIEADTRIELVEGRGQPWYE